MGSIASQLKDATPPPRGKGGVACRFSRVLAECDDEDAAAIRDLVKNRDLTNPQVASLLSDVGIDIDQQMIGRHRQGMCRTCGPLGG